MSFTRSLLGLFLVLSVTLSPLLAGGVAIIDTVLTDNGDGDGFADTRETVQMAITVQNTSGVALGDVTARLVTPDGQLVCITQPTIEIGDLAIGEVRVVPTPFILKVLDVDRTEQSIGPLDPLTAHFQVVIDSQPYPPAHPRKFALDLDLDASGGSGPTSFFETFESETLGQFEVQNLDQGQFTTEASDGYRCQYSDPDGPNSNLENHPQGIPGCHLGNSLAHADAVFWGLSGPEFSPLGGRAFSGFNSMFYGFDFGPDVNWTTPLANLEAVRTSAPIHLGWDGAAHTLSFKHQVSLADGTTFGGLQPHSSFDRGVVMVQLADGSGAPVGPWIKIEPYWNVYEQQNATNFFNCSFDPVDDGTTEDDFFQPADPERRYGPSSTCFPEHVFARVGETSSPFAVGNVGAADGPGLAGVWGIGTWIESKFDLERFRGRSIRVRFLASTLEVNGPSTNIETWAQYLNFDPVPGDDGWWIDDVQVTGTLTTSADVTVDIHDNSGLPGLPAGSDDDSDGFCDTMDNCALAANADQLDQDNDGAGDLCDPCPALAYVSDPDLDSVCAGDNCPLVANASQSNGDNDPAGAACDCDDADPETYPGASEVNDGVDNQCAGDAGHGVADEISGTAGFFDPANKDKFSWPAQPGATRYRVARALSPDFTVSCTALPLATSTFIIDTTAVSPGTVHHYLVRAQLPIKGSFGQDSEGVARSVPCAP